MKYETRGVDNEEFNALKSKMYLLLVDYSSKHKNGKGVNKNVVGTISHSEHKDVLLNKKCLRHSKNRIQRKNKKTGTCKINKISSSCFYEKI